LNRFPFNSLLHVFFLFAFQSKFNKELLKLTY
jgi:hypothetical protein